MNEHLIDKFGTNCGATAPLELNVRGPGGMVERRSFEQPFALIGRHEQCGLRLEDGAVSRQHAYLQQIGGRVFCVDLGSRTGVRWGDERRPAGWLRPQQGVQIGPFTVEAPAAQDGDQGNPLEDKATAPRLLPLATVEVGDEVRARLVLDRMLVLVGSAPACRIRLRDAGIWGYHCSLVRTPQGVWLVDLRPGGGGWSLLAEEDQLELGPYVLRVWYPDARPQPVAAEVSVPVPALPAALEEVRQRQQEAATLRQQLADNQAERERLLAEQQAARQAAEQALADARTGWESERQSLTAQLERERQSHAEAVEAATRDAQTRLTTEQDEWRQRLEAAEQQRAAEREAVRAAAARLDEESAALQRVQAELSARNAEHGEALQRLQAAQDAHALTQDEARNLRAELDQAQVRQRELDAVKQELAGVRDEHAQLGARLPELESRATAAETLSAQLRDASAAAEQLRAQLREAESWQSEAHNLQARLAAITGDLERARAEAVADREAALAEARAAGEAQRQALEAQLERERQAHAAALQTAARDAQPRLTGEVAEWRQRFEAAQQQLIWERGLIQAQGEQLRQQLVALQADRDRLAAQLTHAETLLKAVEERNPEELQRLRQKAAVDRVFVQFSGLRP